MISHYSLEVIYINVIIVNECIHACQNYIFTVLIQTCYTFGSAMCIKVIVSFF